MIISSLLEFSLCLIEVFAAYFFMDLISPHRFSYKSIMLLIAFADATLVFLMPQLTYLKIIRSVISTTIGFLILYKIKIYVASVFSMTFLYLLYIIDIITGNLLAVITSHNILSIFYDNLLQRAIICLIVKGLDILAFYFLYRLFRKSDFNFSKKYWILYNIIMFTFLIISAMFMIFYESDSGGLYDEILYLVLSAFFFIMSLIVIYFFAYVLENGKNSQKYLVLQANYDAVNESLLLQKEHNDKFNKLRHDIKNHLSLASSMLEQKQYDKAKSILSDVINQAEVMSISLDTSSGNSIVDAIIATKSASCKNLGVDFIYALDYLPELDNIDVLDLSSVLTNLLDNAIDAAVTAAVPYIEVKILMYNSYLTIFVKNTYSVKPEVSVPGRSLISTKTHHRELHGYGTQIISDIAEKYTGSFEWVVDDEYFKATVILNINRKA